MKNTLIGFFGHLEARAYSLLNLANGLKVDEIRKYVKIAT